MEEEESWIGEVAEREEKKKRGEGLVNWVVAVVVVVVGWRSGRRRVWELEVDGNLVKEKKKRGEGLMVVSESEGNITRDRLDSIAQNGTKELSTLLS